MTAHSNTPQRGIYNYACRPILRTGLRPVQLFVVVVLTGILKLSTYITQTEKASKEMKMTGPSGKANVSVKGRRIITKEM